MHVLPFWPRELTWVARGASSFIRTPTGHHPGVDLIRPRCEVCAGNRTQSWARSDRGDRPVGFRMITVQRGIPPPPQRCKKGPANSLGGATFHSAFDFCWAECLGVRSRCDYFGTVSTLTSPGVRVVGVASCCVPSWSDACFRGHCWNRSLQEHPLQGKAEWYPFVLSRIWCEDSGDSPAT